MMIDSNNYNSNIKPPQEIPLTNIKNTTNNGKAYTIIGNKVVEEVENLSTRDYILIAFKNIQNDPIESQKFNVLSPKEQQQYLVDKVVGNWKITHSLKGSEDQNKNSNNRVNNITTNIAQNKQNDVLVNSEIGIIKDEENDTITKINETTSGEIKVTETNSYGKSEIYNPQKETNTPNEERDNNHAYNSNDAYLSDNRIENNYITTPFDKSQSKARKKILQPNNYSRTGYINISMIIITLTLSTIIGITIGYLLYTNIYP